MPQHFVNLPGAATLPTRHYQLTGQIIDDLIAELATGVVHGPAGTGKTYAVQAALERLRAAAEPSPADSQVTVCTLAFPSKPTMRLVADELLTVLTGAAAPRSRNRFHLIAALVDVLSGPRRLVVIDEAQRLNGDCIELIRHLHDHPHTRFALLYVGGDGCWEVLSREPMLASRVFRRLPFTRLDRPAVPALMRRYHPVYEGADEALLLEIEDAYGKGMLRNWAVFTHAAAGLCAKAGTGRITAEVAGNVYAKLGGGIR
jgi:type II secretory pathway predicted ATPase ExeA